MLLKHNDYKILKNGQQCNVIYISLKTECSVRPALTQVAIVFSQWPQLKHSGVIANKNGNLKLSEVHGGLAVFMKQFI